MRAYIMRDFTYNEDNDDESKEYGDITIYVCKKNYLCITITNLHNSFHLYCENDKAHMLVYYNENNDLFDIINTILDKLSHDIHYMHTGYANYHKDYICHNSDEIKNPNLWNTKKMIGYTLLWIPFTRENMEHVNFEDITDDEINDKNYALIRGEVDKNGVFTYDYPIVDDNCTYNMYLESRGKLDYNYNLPLEYYYNRFETDDDGDIDGFRALINF
jgi:hypothetical protein